MANEEQLRSRWRDVYRNSSEYQDALRKLAIDTEQRKAKFEGARHAATDPQEIADIARQERAAEKGSTAAAVIRGLDRFQEDRTQQYITDTRKKGLERSMQPTLVSESPQYRRQFTDPDFSQHYPYGQVRDFQLNQPRVQEGLNDNGSDEPNQPDDGDALKRAAEARQYEGQMAERQKLLYAQKTVGKFAPDLQNLFKSLPPQEQDFILKKSPEDMLATLSSHPLRPKPQPKVTSAMSPEGPPNIPQVTNLVSQLFGGNMRSPTLTPSRNIQPTQTPPNRPAATIMPSAPNPFTPAMR